MDPRSTAPKAEQKRKQTLQWVLNQEAAAQGTALQQKKKEEAAAATSPEESEEKKTPVFPSLGCRIS